MPKTATIPTRPARPKAPAAATPSRTAGRDVAPGRFDAEEARPRPPQEFYAEMTKRPDVREILKQLADG